MNTKKEYTNVNISIYEKEVFADYGYDNQELMEETLINTIYKLAETKPIRGNLELSFAKKEDVSFDEERFKSAYKNSITAKTKSLSHEIIRCAIVGSILLFLGLALLCLSVFVLDGYNSFLYAFSDIFAWVFCWCGIEVLTIQITQLAIEKKKYKRLLNSKITFKN